MQLIGEFADKSQAHDAHGDGLLNETFRVPRKRQHRVGNIDIDYFFQDLAGIGAGKIDDAHSIGQVDQMEVPAVKPGVIADPLDGLPGPAAGGGEVVVVLTQLGHHAVIDDAAVVVAHGRVLDAPGFYLAHVGDIDPLQGLERIGPMDAELAQGGAVEHAHVVSHIENLFLAVEIGREVAGPLPDTDIAEDAAIFDLIAVHGRAFEHVMVVAGIGGDEGRHQGRALGRGNRRVDGCRMPGDEQGQVVPRDAALPRAGTGGSKALDQLGHVEPHGNGLFDVLDRGVLVKADEAFPALDRRGDQLAAALGAGQSGKFFLRIGHGSAHPGTGGIGGVEAGQPSGRLDGHRIVEAGHAAGGKHLLGQVGRQEVAGQAVVAHGRPSQDKGPVDRGQSGRRHQQIAVKFPFDGAFHRGQSHFLHRLAAAGPGGHPALEQRDFAFGQSQHQIGILAVCTDIGHAGHLEPQVEQIRGRLEPQVVAHGEDRLAARQNAVGAGQAMGAAHLHDTGPLVVVEQQRTLDAAGGHHDARRTDLDVAFGEGVGLSADLKGGNQVIGVATDHGGLGEDPDIGCPGHGFGKLAGPPVKGRIINRRGDPVIETAAQMRTGLEQDHPLAGLGGGQGGLHAGGTTADDGHLGREIAFIVLALHLVIRRNDAQAGRLANLFHGQRPDGGGLVHDLVVETRRHHPVQLVHEGHPVEIGGTDHVLGLDGHAGFQWRVLGAHVGDAVHFHAGVAAFAVQAVKAAGTMIFQAAPEDTHATGVKGRCHGVAGDPLNGFAPVGQSPFVRSIDSQGG
ncbi:hypothetical protein DESC_610353 [Desulfosarcina cetonica]|nr:hypothetical protein DESC_610353 [Desulfosarcina cetonica]